MHQDNGSNTSNPGAGGSPLAHPPLLFRFIWVSIVYGILCPLGIQINHALGLPILPALSLFSPPAPSLDQLIPIHSVNGCWTEVNSRSQVCPVAPRPEPSFQSPFKMPRCKHIQHAQTQTHLLLTPVLPPQCPFTIARGSPLS